MRAEQNHHNVYVVGFVLIILVIIWSLARPLISNWREKQKDQGSQSASEAILKAPSITAEDLFKKTEDGSKIFLLDISDSSDFNQGHLKTSVNVPADKIDKDFLASLGAEKTSDVFVVNRGEGLEKLAEVVNSLVDSGFANTKYLRGGIADWRDKGYPLISSGGSSADNFKVKKITIDEISNETNPQILLFLDVRDAESFKKEHIVQAMSIPLSELEARKGEIPAVKKIIVYGADENDGFQAAVKLFDMNILSAYRLDGNLDQWKAAGGNTVNQ